MRHHPYLNRDIESAYDALNASKVYRLWMLIDELAGGIWERKSITSNDACQPTYMARNNVQDLREKGASALCV